MNILRNSWTWALLSGFSILAAALVPPALATVPPGFLDEPIEGGFVLPVAIAFDGDGRMFIVEKRGIVHVIQNGVLLPTPFIDLSDEVQDAGDKGLLGFALDPAFATNRFAYFLYNVDPIFGAPDEPSERITVGRLVRYTAFGSGNVVNLNTRLELLGVNFDDGIANCHSSHAVGTVTFGTDGTLFVGSGDGAHFDFTDGGQDVTIFDPFCAQAFGSEQDVGALRAQIFESLSGKILRIDPATGLGLADNPFYDGDPASFDSRIFAMGLRNPFRFTVRPGSPAPGTLYIGDVGWGTYEELNVSTGGENFGWPCWEGPFEQGSYQSHSITGPFCQSLDPQTLTMPLIAWHHGDPGSLGFTGNTSSGACFYTGAQFPVQYQGRCFFADYGQNWIRVAEVDAQNQLVSISPFAENLGTPVDVKVDPATGDLVYAAIAQGEVRRIRWILGDVPPVVQISAQPVAGGLPLPVQFSSDGTYDPNGDSFTLTWNFGDGSPISNEANPLHTYTSLGTFIAQLKATDTGGNSDSADITIETLNLPPTVEIVNPQHGSTFTPGEWLVLSADASDPEDGPNVSYNWNVQLIHNEHLHPGWFTSSLESPLFQATDHGAGVDRFSYMIILTVTDSGSLAAADTSVILPSNLPPNQTPISVIEASPVEGPTPLHVSLSANESVDPDGDYLFYAWDFGDGTTGANPSTTHIYDVPGLYTITLTVTDPILATGVSTATVFAEPGGASAIWQLDELSGSTALDSSGNSNHASLSGGPVWISGVHGNALDFDGANDAATGPMELLSDRGAFTLAAWVRPDAFGDRIGIVGQNDAIEFGFISPANLQIWTPGGGSVTVAYPAALGTWHHVAATGDGVQLRVYLDGEVIATSVSVTSSYGRSSFPVRFGGGGIFDEAGNHLNGAMDDVRVYPVALSPESIALLSAFPGENAAPLVDAGEDFSTSPGELAPLLATISDDGLPAPPGQVSVMWSQVSGPAAASIANPDHVFTLVTCPVAGQYVFEITADDGDLFASDEITVTVVDPTGVGLFGIEVGLHGVVPNPTRSASAIAFGVARDGTHVRIDIVDVSGRRVATLANSQFARGEHRAKWDALDASGRRVAAGIYFAVLEIDRHRFTKKIVVIR